MNLLPNLARRAILQRASITPALARSYGDASSPSKDSLKAKTESETQGHVIDPKNKHKSDVEGEAVRAGGKARSAANDSVDGASPKPKQKPKDTGSGNPEGIGFVEQVGGASASAQHFEGGKGNETAQKR